MMRVFLCALIILFVVGLSVQTTLDLVQVFFRHGSRTPELKDTYPLDPYKEKDFMPMGWGQLTNAGKHRAFKLGQLLRTRYDSFLGDIYTPGMVYAQSTDFDRTKMSALLVLAGLFQPSSVQKWHNELAWIPIPYHVEKAENDFFLRRPTNYCPTYINELENVFRTNPAVQKILEENKQLLNYISVNTNKPMTSLMDVFRIYQTLNAEEALNMTLPNWTETVYPRYIHDLAGRQCYYENSNQILKRLNGGRSLSKVIQNMNVKMINSTSPTQINLYSGHENNVVNILSALDVFEPHVPKYSAAVILELHNFKTKEADDYKVRILYVRDVDDKHEPEVKIIDNCEEFCPFQRFVDLTRPNVPGNYTQECESLIPLD